MGIQEKKSTVLLPPDEVASSSTSSGSPAENDKKPQLNWQTWMAIVALMFQLNSYLFTLSMPPAVLAFINEDIGPHNSYTWITVSWNLGAAVIVTVSGRIADIFGRRWFLITGAALGCIGSLVGATAKNIPTMIVSGVIFGIGGGFQEMCFSCIQEMVPNRYRFIILGVNELSNTPSQFSALISYAFIAYVPLGWRTCYYWCFAFEFVSVILLFLFYRPPSFETKHQEDRKTKIQLLRELDYIGLIIFTGACTILLMAINWGGSMHPWKSAAVIAPICISGVLFILLGFWEVYAPLKYPILPPRLFQRWRDFTSILVVVFVCGILYYSNLVLWPRISSLLFVPSDEIIMRGLYANMTAFAVILASLYCVLIMPWVGHERWQLVALSVIQTAFIGGFSSMSIDDQAKQIAFLLIAGMAATASSPLVFGMISLGLEDQTDIGLAIGLVSTSRLVGGAVGGAVYTSIYTNRYVSNIPGEIKKAAASSGFTGPVDQLLKASATNTREAYNAVPGINDAVIAASQLAVKFAYVDAFSLVYEVAIAFGALAIVASLCTRTVDKTKKSNSRAVHLENEKPPRADLESTGRSS